jgi:hypothetical protein
MEAGSDDERKFIATVKQNSEVSLWSTIIGIGMDLARDTVEETSKTPGCNYATVISNKDFREMIDNEFDYTVVRPWTSRRSTMVQPSETERSLFSFAIRPPPASTSALVSTLTCGSFTRATARPR